MFTGDWEGNRIDEQVIDVLGIWVNYQVHIVFNHVIQIEISPVRDMFSDFLGDFIVEVLETHVSIELVHHDLVEFELCVDVWSTDFVDLSTSFFQFEAVQDTLSDIIDMDWLSELLAVVEDWDEVIPGVEDGSELFDEVIVRSEDLVEKLRNLRIVVCVLTVVGLMMVAFGNSSKTACSPQYLVYKSKLGESGLAPTAEK